MKAARLYTSSYPADGGLKLDNDGGVWSFRDPNVLYTFGPLTPTLSKYDFSDRVNPPTPTPLFDFRSGSHCLPAGFKASWSTVGGGNTDDTVFGVAYSDKGGQGTGVYAVAYKAGEGCTLYNTQTGQVTGDWGTRGTVTVPDRFTIHNVKLSKDGNWLVIVSTTCFAGPCDGVFFWQVGTTTVNACGKIGCGGHWSEGYTTWINSDGTPNSGGTYQTGQYKARKFSSLEDPREVISQFPAGLQAPFDQHASWNNVDPADSHPFFSSTFAPDTSDGKPWSGKFWAYLRWTARFGGLHIPTSRTLRSDLAHGTLSEACPRTVGFSRFRRTGWVRWDRSQARLHAPSAPTAVATSSWLSSSEISRLQAPHFDSTGPAMNQGREQGILCRDGNPQGLILQVTARRLQRSRCYNRRSLWFGDFFISRTGTHHQHA